MFEWWDDFFSILHPLAQPPIVSWPVADVLRVWWYLDQDWSDVEVCSVGKKALDSFESCGHDKITEWSRLSVHFLPWLPPRIKFALPLHRFFTQTWFACSIIRATKQTVQKILRGDDIWHRICEKTTSLNLSNERHEVLHAKGLNLGLIITIWLINKSILPRRQILIASDVF